MTDAEYSAARDYYRVPTTGASMQFWGGAGAPYQYDYYKENDPNTKADDALTGMGEHDESARSMWAGYNSQQYVGALNKSAAQRTALDKARLESPGAIGQALIRPDLVGLNSLGMSGAELAFYDPNLLAKYGITLTPQQQSAIASQLANSTPQAQDDGDGGFGLMQLAMLVAAVYSGGAALGAWGAGAGVAAGATTASGMLAAESAALLAEGFTAAEVAGSLAGLGNAAQIGSVLTAAGISSATAATLAGDVVSGILTGANVGSVAPAGWTQSAWDGLMSGNYSAVTGANAGSGAMDFSNLGDLWNYGGNSTPDFTSMIGPGGDVNSAIDAIQQYAAQNPGFDPMQAMQQVNNAASGGDWTNFLNTGAIGDPSTAMSMMQRLQSMGLSPTDALKAVKSAMSGGDSIAGRALSGGLGAIGGALTGNAAVDAAKIKAQSDIATAQLAADHAKFKPYGMTTFAGQSNFIKDAQGNVIGAGYTAAPWAKSQQDALLGMSVDALDQYRAAPGMFAPMGTAGQRAMSLGNQYLATDPQAQAQKYMNDQQALLATGRERDMNQMLTGEFNRGTYGLGVGATSTGMGAANPRMEAMLNAQRQQDLGLAAQATQGGMDYAKFGTGMVGLGGDLTKGMLAGQTAAFDPYKTALGGASTIEGLAQQPLTLGADLGKANMNTGAASLLMQGGLSANQANQNAGSFSPWGNLLSGAANQVSNYQNQQQQQQQNQQLMNALAWGK